MQKRIENIRLDCGCFRSHILYATWKRAVSYSHWCDTRPVSMVCPGTCHPMPIARFLYSRSNCSLCQSRFRYQVFRSKRKEMVILHGCRRFGKYFGCMFVHHPAVVHRHIQTRSRIGAGHRIPQIPVRLSVSCLSF